MKREIPAINAAFRSEGHSRARKYGGEAEPVLPPASHVVLVLLDQLLMGIVYVLAMVI